MTAANPWSVKGIDPKAREIAKDLARRSGMTLGEWLNQMILEGEPEAPPFQFADPLPSRFSGAYPNAPVAVEGMRGGEMHRIARALDELSARMEAAENRSTLAISGVDQSVMGVLSRLESVERDQSAVAARFDGALEDVRQAQGKSDDRARRVAEEDGPRREAMKALEGAVGKVAEKLYEGEGHTRSAMNAVREDLADMVRRLGRVESRADADPSAAVIEGVVARIAEQMEGIESRTSTAVKALETSFAGLDARLKAGEVRPQADDGEHRFAKMAAELSEKVEATRAEMADRLRAATDGKLDRLEVALRDLAGHVEQGERNSAEAIDRMGREVSRVASTFGERVSKVEARGLETAQQVGGEMARIADVMEQRIAKADAAQAQALEKLGGEIARIAEKLSERIANADRRSTQAIEDVGDQFGRATERMDQRHEQSQTQLAERIRASEERTAKLLDEARERLDTRLGEVQRRQALEAAAETARAAALAETRTEAVAPYSEEPPPFPAAGSVQAVATAIDDDPFSVPGDSLFKAEAPQVVEPEAPPARPLAAVDMPVEPEPFDAAWPEAPTAEAAPPSDLSPVAEEPKAVPADDMFVPFETPAVATAERRDDNPTRDMIEQARAAARRASEGGEGGVRGGRIRLRRLPTAADGAVTAPPREDAPARGFAFGLPKRRKKEGVTLRTAILASGTAAALAVTGAGAVLLANSESGLGAGEHHDVGPAPTAVAAETPPTSTPGAIQTAAIARPGLAPETPTSAPPAAGAAPERLAVAITPPVGALTGAPAASSTAPSDSGGPVVRTPLKPAPSASDPNRALYSSAVRRIESGDISGVASLRKAAASGYAPAEFYLGKLYENGGSGVKKDLAEARAWTQRAADGGDATAMHNLGLYYYEGEAGPQDPAKAAAWFRKAADAGVKDSQYNLALLYAKGYGVPQNLAEAYKWYLVAAARGDDGARKAALALKAQLTPEVQAASERSAAGFHASSDAAIRTASAATPPQ